MRAEPRERNRLDLLTGGGVMEGQFRDGVPRPTRRNDRAGHLGTVEQLEALEHRLRILTDDLAPLVMAWVSWVGNAQSPPRRVVIGQQPHLPVGANARLGPSLDPRLNAGEDRTIDGGGVLIGHEHIIPPRSRARVDVDDEPSPVAAHSRVIPARQSHPGAAHNHVGRLWRADSMQPDTAVMLALGGGDLLWATRRWQ
jgi:hypothetical protein